MNSRQRGAALLLAALLGGRLLDRCDLAFERRVADGGGPDSVRVTLPARIRTTGDSLLRRPAARDTGEADSVLTARARAGAEGPIAVNRAGARALERLPGVGPVLAARIVAERDANGPFRDAADLRRVRGIGVKTAERLAPHLRFD